MTFSITERPSGSGAACRAILTTIEPWFGLEASNAQYAALAETGPTVLALDERGAVAGLMILKRHFGTALEIYFIGVDAGRHRQGAGRALVARAEAVARAERRRFLTVKTRGPSLPYEPYERTRRFYAALGFVPIEEVVEIWGPENPALIMVKAVG